MPSRARILILVILLVGFVSPPKTEAQETPDYVLTSPVFSPDGTHIAVLKHSRAISGIYIIDVETGVFEPLIKVQPDGIWSFDWLLDGTLWYVGDTVDSRQILSFDPTSHESVELTAFTPADIQSLGVNREGTQYAFLVCEQDVIGCKVVINQTDAPEDIIAYELGAAMVGRPSWHPVESIVALTLISRDGDMDICVFNVETAMYGCIEEVGNQAGPTWSADGQQLSFMVEQSNSGWDVCYAQITTDGFDQINCSRTAYGQMYPTWSPDGTKLAYIDISQGYHLYIWDILVDEHRCLTCE